MKCRYRNCSDGGGATGEAMMSICVVTSLELSLLFNFTSACSQQDEDYPLVMISSRDRSRNPTNPCSIKHAAKRLLSCEESSESISVRIFTAGESDIDKKNITCEDGASEMLISTRRLHGVDATPSLVAAVLRISHHRIWTNRYLLQASHRLHRANHEAVSLFPRCTVQLSLYSCLETSAFHSSGVERASFPILSALFFASRALPSKLLVAVGPVGDLHLRQHASQCLQTW